MVIRSWRLIAWGGLEANTVWPQIKEWATLAFIVSSIIAVTKVVVAHMEAGYTAIDVATDFSSIPLQDEDQGEFKFTWNSLQHTLTVLLAISGRFRYVTSQITPPEYFSSSVLLITSKMAQLRSKLTRPYIRS